MTNAARPQLRVVDAGAGPDSEQHPIAQLQRHRHPRLALAVIGIAQLMVVLDATVVNVALPPIRRDLGFSPTGLEWVITSYSLAFGGLLLFGGRTGDLFGRRRMFMIGIGLFAGASLLGGLGGAFVLERHWHVFHVVHRSGNQAHFYTRQSKCLGPMPVGVWSRVS